jgi:hypothetical protein
MLPALATVGKVAAGALAAGKAALAWSAAHPIATLALQEAVGRVWAAFDRPRSLPGRYMPPEWARMFGR